MKQKTFLFAALTAAFLSVASFATVQAQIIDELNETLLTEESYNQFTAVSVTGDRTWYFDSKYGACMSGYSGGQNYDNEDWFISPELDLSTIDSVKLTFDHTRGNANVMNAGMSEGWYKVFATANYTGDPTTTQWIELENVVHATQAWQYVSSGELAVPADVKSENTRIAFRYISSNTESATWEIKNVRVTGRTSTPPDESGVFKITTWNVEWLGCTENGPTDENLQVNNVVSAIRTMNPDIIAVQEVTQSGNFPSINTLVSLLGSEWGGNIVPSSSTDCSQNQGIIYKKSKVQFVSSSLMSSGINAQGNTYRYNWSSGRYPALYNVNLSVGDGHVPVSLVNIHAKAANDQASYTRRKGGSEGLKALLDESSYNTKNIIIIGDFNDYLTGTQCASMSDSPYKNFMVDVSNYMGLTQDLIDTRYSSPTIDNMIISNELFDNYNKGSVLRETSLSQTISNFRNTTSDHTPISALFRFLTAVETENINISKSKLCVYPNPVLNGELNVKNVAGGLLQLFDCSGRVVLSKSVTGGDAVIEMSSISEGIYILRNGENVVRVVKRN